ncbi:hypothetical protein [Intestinibacter sp.]|uniref:hypothetical protein n=1 Tax=Intestinibacter sp. TaxID=1965304 RepID=UPI003F164DAA
MVILKSKEHRSIAVPILLKNDVLYGTVSITASTTIIEFIYENSLKEVLDDLNSSAKLVSDKINSIM